ncbi:MAG: hypothetical protein ABI611_13575 [Solirubrobacteraceae bacterium]
MTRTPIALALLLAVIAGCGSSSSSSSPASSSKTVDPNAKEVSPAGDIPDNQAYVAYSPPGADYSVKVPEGWARSAAGRAVTFTDKLNSIRMEEGQAKGPPYRPGKASVVRRTSGRVVRITSHATSPPDPVTGRTRTNAVERYLFVRNGKQVTLTLSGPKGADNVDPWKLVTDSLKWTR